MTKSLQQLLADVVDYAGLFPPAGLGMEQALKNYATYRSSPHSWMLARFVCPALRLSEIDEHVQSLMIDAHNPWTIAALGASGSDLSAFLQALQQDLSAIRTFLETHEGSFRVDVLEIRLPDEVIAAGDERIRELVERSAAMIAEYIHGPVTPFYEINCKDSDPSIVKMSLEALKRFNEEWASEERYQVVGAKLRAGGVTRDAFPGSGNVAFFMSVCQRLGLKFKATAGLHHPLRHQSSDLGMMHGFLNLFVAVVMADRYRLELGQLLEIIEARDIASFQFNQDGIALGQWTASTDHITQARSGLGISFGSCSFTEPIDDLTALGLM